MRNRGNLKIKLLIGVGIILFSFFKYWAKSETNQYTGKKQHISLTTDQEIQLGLHSAPEIAKHELTNGILGGILAGTNPSMAKMASVVTNFKNLKYGRTDELEADNLGVKFMIDAGYNPYHFIEVMEILDQASGGQAPPEFQSTHPSVPYRVEEIKATINEYGYVAPANLSL